MAAPARSLLAALRAAGRGAHPLATLAEAAGLTPAQAQKAVRMLHRHRLVAAADGGYQLTRAGWEATDPPPPAPPPPPPPPGPPPATPGCLADQLWRALRIERRASLNEMLELLELPATSGAVTAARRYLGALRKVGVTDISRFKAPGPQRKVQVHRLLLDLGPQAPVIRRAGGRHLLVDPNSGCGWDLSSQPVRALTAQEVTHG